MTLLLGLRKRLVCPNLLAGTRARRRVSVLNFRRPRRFRARKDEQIPRTQPAYPA